MWAIIVLLWIMVVYRALQIIAYNTLIGQVTTTEYTNGVVIWNSFTTMLSGIILAFAAVLLQQLS